MKILGIDYGRRKIGLAIGDSESGLAEPLGTFKNFQLFPLRQSFAGRAIFNYQTIVNDQNIKKIIIGVAGGRIDKEIKKFGEWLQRGVETPVEFFDETLTTQDAQRLLIESGKKRKDRKEKEDAIAAAIMLESYLGRLR